MNQFSEKRAVAVIGAGPMGLAVAWQLLKNGHAVTVYETDGVVGGMTACFDFSGLRIERYYHFICTPDQPLFDMLKELGIADRLRWKETRMGFFIHGVLYPWGNPLALLKCPALGWPAKFRYGLHAFACQRRRNWQSLDGVQASQWIRRWVGKQAYEVLWRNLLDLKFYGHARNLSAAWIWTRIKRVGSSRYSLMREKLGYLDGGSDVLLQALSKAIVDLGGRIELNAKVEQVLIRDQVVRGIRVNGVDRIVTQVVSTVPIPYVNAMIPDLPRSIREQFRALKNIAVVCVICKLRRKLSDNFWVNINDPEIGLPGIIEYSNLNPLDYPVVYAPYYMPAEHPLYQQTDEEFLQRTRTYLKKLNPVLADEDFIAMQASRYRFAQPVCEPGYLQKLPPIKLPIAGLYVADTSYYYPEDRGISESFRLGREIAALLGQTSSGLGPDRKV